jgi:CheY-like chemotaxis protein
MSHSKVMVVEDDLDETMNIKLILEKKGYTVIEAANGKEAQEKLEGNRPDFILLDVMMPEVDGFAFCKWVKSRDNLKDIPVAFLTAVSGHIYDSKYPRMGIVRSDADEYLEKPVKPEMLLETIERLTQ